MSAYEGYLSLGGNEIVNNSRVRGYAETAQCPMWWLRGPVCESMADALGDEPYNAQNLTDAPWYDPDSPDRSARFFGAFAYSIEGVYDSTRSAAVVEGVDDGGRVGRVRKRARQVKMKAILMAQGADAREYGMAWLSAALDPNACGQHGDTCGSTDLEFMVDCPPPRGTVAEWGPWTETRRNGAPNPTFEPGITLWAGAAGRATIAQDTTRARYGEASAKVTVTNAEAGSSYASTTAAGRAVLTGGAASKIGVSIFVTSARNSRVAFIEYDAGGAQLRTTWLPDAALNVGDWTDIEYEFTAHPDTASALLQVGIGGELTDGMDWWFDGVYAGAPGDYFDGDTEGDDFTRYSWAGAPGTSASIMETRQQVERPRTDAEYAPLVDEVRRYLHNVVAVSGPLITATHEVNGFHAYEVEVVFVAERPWVYSVTRPVDLPRTASTVIEDIAHNLTPYPSAERAGEEVLTALNLSTNPSAEVNLTGWSADAPVAVSGSSPTPYVAALDRSGEKFAAGIWSARRRLLGTATVASGRATMNVGQQVALGARPAGTRYSVNIWGALTNQGGSGTVLRALRGSVVWRGSSGGAALRTDPLGEVTTPAAIAEGQPFIAKSILPPAGATHASVYVQGEFDWASGPSPSDVRLYADALALTIP